MGKKKHSLLVKGLVAAGGYVAANAVGVKLRYDKVMKEMEQTAGNHQMYSVMFGKHNVDVHKDTVKSYLTCTNGSMTVKLEEAPESGELTIDLCTVLGKITILLPPGAAIDYNVTGSMEKFSDMRADGDAEKSYTVHIIGKSVLSEIVIDGIAGQ